jgi:L-iditol 2-dehydrogenase/L-gulonate 5-dehydrogenase
MTSMNALIFNGPRKVEYGVSQRPEIRPDHVVVRVGGCGICGTDLHVYKGMPATWPVPGVRGHEIAGIVESVGHEVETVTPGDKVVVQPLVFCGSCTACQRGETNLCSRMYLVGGEVPGGFAEYVAAPATSIFHIPGGLSLEHASLAETLATPVRALETHYRGFMRSVAILGAGAQGLLTLQLTRLLGARSVLVSDVVPSRLSLARSLGATHVVDARETDPVAAAREMSGGEGVDLVIDAAGLAVNRQQTVAMLRAGGTGIFLALGPSSAPIEFSTLVPRELHLHGTQCYTNADFARAIELLASGEVRAAPIVDVMALSDGPAAFELLATNPGDHIKIVLRPQ